MGTPISSTRVLNAAKLSCSPWRCVPRHGAPRWGACSSALAAASPHPNSDSIGSEFPCSIESWQATVSEIFSDEAVWLPQQPKVQRWDVPRVPTVGAAETYERPSNDSRHPAVSREVGIA